MSSPVNFPYMNTSGTRLRELLDQSGIAYKDFAQAIGVEPQHVNHWFKRGIPKAQIFPVADYLKVLPRWLVEGSGPKNAVELDAAARARIEEQLVQWEAGQIHSPHLEPLLPWDSNTPLGPDEVEVPLFKEVELAAGAGRTAVREVEGRKLRFSYATLRSAGVQPEHAVCATVSGNSMEPLLMNGTTVGLDRVSTRIIDGEIYALEHDGMLRVKFLYRLPGGGIRMRSFNQAEHKDEDYTEEEQEEQRIHVLGRVFWWSTVRPLKSAPLL